jgi:hypothetical protein
LGRVAEKKAEESKIIAEARESARLEIAEIQRQLEGEKLRIEQEYVEIRRQALDERTPGIRIFPLSGSRSKTRRRISRRSKPTARELSKMLRRQAPRRRTSF